MPRAKFRENPQALALLAVLLAVASFFMFQVLLSGKASPYASEIGAAVLGGLLTAVITMVLLVTQAEQEMKRERSATLLSKKLEVYQGLLDELTNLLAPSGEGEDGQSSGPQSAGVTSGNGDKGTSSRRRYGTVTPQNVVRAWMLTQHLGYLGSEEVVKAANSVVSKFRNVAADGKISTNEMDELLGLMARLTAAMRKDVLSTEPLQPLSDDAVARFEQTLTLAARALTDKESFLGRCPQREADYFQQVLDHLEAQAIVFEWGTSGLTVNGYVHLYPSAAARSCQFLLTKMEQQQPEAAQAVSRLLADPGRRLQRSETQGTVKFQWQHVPASDLCAVLSLLPKREPEPVAP